MEARHLKTRSGGTWRWTCGCGELVAETLERKLGVGGSRETLGVAFGGWGHSCNCRCESGVWGWRKEVETLEIRSMELEARGRGSGSGDFCVGDLAVDKSWIGVFETRDLGWERAGGGYLRCES